jgi:hypothetical protein
MKPSYLDLLKEEFENRIWFSRCHLLKDEYIEEMGEILRSIQMKYGKSIFRKLKITVQNLNDYKKQRPILGYYNNESDNQILFLSLEYFNRYIDDKETERMKITGEFKRIFEYEIAHYLKHNE